MSNATNSNQCIKIHKLILTIQTNLKKKTKRERGWITWDICKGAVYELHMEEGGRRRGEKAWKIWGGRECEDLTREGVGRVDLILAPIRFLFRVSKQRRPI